MATLSTAANILLKSWRLSRKLIAAERVRPSLHGFCSAVSKKNAVEFDYIIVGAGTAGCVLAGRLAASQTSARIALVETGGDEIQRPEVADLLQWPLNFEGPVEYGYNTVSQQSFGNQFLDYPLGRGLGGTSLISFGIYSRGFRSHWDRMPEGWRSVDMAPIFDSVESQLDFKVTDSPTWARAIMAGAKGLGFPVQAIGDWEKGGMADATRTLVDGAGRRADLYRIFGANRSNVQIIQGSVHKVLFSNGSSSSSSSSNSSNSSGELVAEGVQIQEADKKLAPTSMLRVRLGGEIILCSGAVGTPRLLQLSGIGPKLLLQSLGIELIQDLPVGDGLTDIPTCQIALFGKIELGNVDEFAPNSVQGFVNDEKHGVGLTIIDAGVLPFLLPKLIMRKLYKPGTFHKILCSFVGCTLRPLVRRVALVSPIRKVIHRMVGLGVALSRPTSQGSVQIQSVDPDVPPKIDPNYLSTEEDKRNMAHGFQLAEKILSSGAVTQLVARTVSAPAPGDGNEDPYLEFWRDKPSARYLATGTCSIGTCLDGELCVRGVRGLRVADASVLPVHPGGPTQAACMAVGARCAELLSGAQVGHE